MFEIAARKMCKMPISDFKTHTAVPWVAATEFSEHQISKNLSKNSIVKQNDY